MKELDALRGIDVYFIDQLLKGNVSATSRILDAGCGSGRNIHYLLNLGINITGIDENPTSIAELKLRYPSQKDQFIETSIEDFQPSARFDFIICNAVLHFANNHAHFNSLFEKIVSFLDQNGILFIRMTSTIGMNLPFSETGVYHLLDGSTRYLITREQVTELCKRYTLSLVEPVKTVKVEELRTMTTLVFRKD